MSYYLIIEPLYFESTHSSVRKFCRVLACGNVTSAVDSIVCLRVSVCFVKK